MLGRKPEGDRTWSSVGSLRGIKLMMPTLSVVMLLVSIVVSPRSWQEGGQRGHRRKQHK